MKEHIFGIVALGILILASCAYGFVLTGTPADQKRAGFDETRISDFRSIRYAVQNYYRTNKRLPLNLSDMELRDDTRLDPETETEYEYAKLSDTSWELCAVFSTDSKEVAARDPNSRAAQIPSEGSDESHKEGRDCITYELPSYLIVTPTPYGIKTPPGAQPGTRLPVKESPVLDAPPPDEPVDLPAR